MTQVMALPDCDCKAGSVTAEHETATAQLLQLKVASILEAHEGALEVLVAGGFEPLKNPVMRLAMAHTVNLSQAFRIRGLGDEAEAAIIKGLLDLGVGREAA